MVGIFKGERKYKYKGKYYYNIPCAFDIETSSFYEGDEKRAIMYIWQFAIGQKCVVVSVESASHMQSMKYLLK